MLECPQCGVRLNQRKTTNGFVYGCAQCGGRAATLPVLRKAGAPRDLLGHLLQAAREETVPRIRHCPHCSRRMSEVTTTVAVPP